MIIGSSTYAFTIVVTLFLVGLAGGGFPGVETVAMTVWPLMSGESAVTAIAINGEAPGEVLSDVLNISPGWMDTMRIRSSGRPAAAASAFREAGEIAQTTLAPRSVARSSAERSGRATA